MRNPQRIDIFLNKIKEGNNLIKMLTDLCKLNLHESYINNEILSNLEGIEKLWKENPDWRFTQVLVNSGLLPNYPGFWYYIEDEDIFMELVGEPKDIYFWGVNYTKDMERLPETKWTLIKDLETDHIEAILDGEYMRSGSKYYKLFKDELKRRVADELSTM